MLLKIADLIVSAPETGGFTSRYQDYAFSDCSEPDIEIDPAKFMYDVFPESTARETVQYLESERLFSGGMLQYGGFGLHASAVATDNRAYLFSGPSGIGKSTHTGQWLKEFGDRARIINDDKTPIRRIDGVWYAFGSPWCGKNDVQINTKVSLAGICFLKQSDKNSIRRLSSDEALSRILAQTIHRFSQINYLNMMMDLLDKLVREIPVFELEDYPGPECVKLSYETMSAAAEEMGL